MSMSLKQDTHPNDLVQRLTGRRYLSYSAISTYQACPLKWYFRNVASLEEAFVSASLVFGGAVHRAVEHHYRELLAGRPAAELDTLLEVYRNAWRERDPAAVRFGKGEDLQSLERLARRVLAAFRQSPFALPAGRIVGVEEQLRGELAADCPDLLARVDLLVDTGDALVVTDLKTARSRWSPQQAEDSAEQLLLYSQLARDLLPGKPLRLQFLVITKAKSPLVESHAVPVDAARLERTRRVIQRTWKAMQAGHVYPGPSPLNCGGCPYRGPCQRWSG
jgi:CRISPR/Cas system-associated exonuclease Cas4 (RecB family)